MSRNITRKANNAAAAGGRFSAAFLFSVFFLSAVPASILYPPAPVFAAFADLGAGARAAGMGNAFVAVADDVFALYFNPAGLALLNQPELATAYARHMTGLSDNSNLNTSFIGYAHPLKNNRGATAAAWQQFDLNGGLYRDQAFYFSYANRLIANLGSGELYGGLNLKLLRRSFGSAPEAGNAMDGLFATGIADPVLSGRRGVGAFDADAGLLYRMRERYSAGLSLTHLTQPNVAFASGGADTLPLGVKLGLNRRSLLSNVGVQYETRQSPAEIRDHRLTIAAERWFPWLLVGNLGARGALSVGNREFRQISAGVSYKDGKIGVDYSFSLPINEIAAMGGTHRVSFSLRFGSAPQPEESVVELLAVMRRLKGGAPEAGLQVLELTPEQKTALEEYLAGAKLLETKGRYREALEQFGKARELNPGDERIVRDFNRLTFVATILRELPDYKTEPYQTVWHQGILAYLSGNDAEAVEKVSRALSLRPESANLEVFLGQLEFVTGIKRSGPLISKPFVEPEQLLAQAALLLQEARYQEAIVLYREVIKQVPNSLPAWENLGIAYFGAGEYPKWVETWEKAYELEKDPARWAALNARLSALRSLKPQPKPVAEAESPEARRTSAEIEKMLTQSFTYLQEGRYAETAPLCLEIIKQQPDNLSAWENLGVAYFAIGDYSRWLETWERTHELEKNPARWESLNTYIRLVRSNYLAASRNQPLRTAAAPAQAEPQNTQSLYNQGIDFYSSGKLGQAKAVFKKLLQLDPKNEPALKAFKRVEEELARQQ